MPGKLPNVLPSHVKLHPFPIKGREIVGKNDEKSLYKLVVGCACAIIFLMLVITVLISVFMVGSLSMENKTTELLELNRGAVVTMQEMKNITREMGKLTREMKEHLFTAFPSKESYHFMHTMYQLTKDLTPSTVDALVDKYQHLSHITDLIDQRLPSYSERFDLILGDVENITSAFLEVAAHLQRTHTINIQL